MLQVNNCLWTFHCCEKQRGSKSYYISSLGRKKGGKKSATVCHTIKRNSSFDCDTSLHKSVNRLLHQRIIIRRQELVGWLDGWMDGWAGRQADVAVSGEKIFLMIDPASRVKLVA